MRGLAVILLSCIMNIFGLSLTNSNESSTKQLLCDTCGKPQSIDGMRKMFGGIFICNSCVGRILSIYLTSNPIKSLCPLCCGKEGDTEKCKYCDIKLNLGDVDDGS